MRTLPSYIQLYESGELARRIDTLQDMLKECRLCPRQCRINRSAGEKGFCRVGARPVISSYGPHFGEERPLVGRQGSGTIFLTWCNLRCVFCQNYDISQLGDGEEMDVEQLAAMMVALWRHGCHNINFVTPTHQIAQIVMALPYAIAQGMDIPLVYNCGGYEEPATIQLLDGIFDIYMPDFKYGSNETAKRYSGAGNYVDKAKESLLEMQRQVGPLQVDARGIAVRGMLIRHLVLPEGMAGTREVMRFIARELSTETYVNIMDQYRPCFAAVDLSPLNRQVSAHEFNEAISIAHDEGLRRLDGFTG